MILISFFSFLIGAPVILWKLTDNLHKKFYRMAKQRGCAEIYDSIVRTNNYTQPHDLESAYREAVICSEAYANFQH